mmetsp:Transcript_5963/g.12237  ORF Transcript_5963/g.12237 Transcript_5963/m.12237 type:complete len:87 (-) Transcript_5963:580-840(-)
MKLCEHLGLEDGEKWIFADIENESYDKLELNRGWDTMIRPATAFRFRDRIFGNNESSNLDQVLYPCEIHTCLYQYFVPFYDKTDIF